MSLLRDDGDAAGARGLLDAAGCLCPTGRLEDGVWDERGGLYALPRWVVAEPVGLREDSEEGGEGDDETGEKMRAGVGVGVGAAGGPAEHLGTGAEADLGGEGDGMEGTDPVTQLRVRARLSDRATDVVVCLSPAAPVRALVRAVQAEAGVSVFVVPLFYPPCPLSSALPFVPPSIPSLLFSTSDDTPKIQSLTQYHSQLAPTSRIRLAYMGRVLRDAEPLPAQGWREGHVVSALVSPAPV